MVDPVELHCKPISNSCPMEGFDAKAVSGILGAPESHRVLAMLPIGYRAEGEAPRAGGKVRFPKEAIFTEVK